jgi:hypothetical protein
MHLIYKCKYWLCKLRYVNPDSEHIVEIPYFANLLPDLSYIFDFLIHQNVQSMIQIFPSLFKSKRQKKTLNYGYFSLIHKLK